jgi:hypothetical protein
MIRDIVRAVLVLVVLAVGCEILAVHRAPPAVATAGQVGWQQTAHYNAGGYYPYPPAAPAVETVGPLRKVARELVDLTEAAIGVIR